MACIMDRLSEPKRQTFSWPSAVTRRRLQPPQKLLYINISTCNTLRLSINPIRRSSSGIAMIVVVILVVVVVVVEVVYKKLNKTDTYHIIHY